MRSRSLLATVLLLGGCARVPVTVATPGPAARQAPAGDPVKDVLRTFLSAARAGQFEAAFGCVSEKWHRRYASARAFGEDLFAEPMASERLTRVEQAVESAPVVLDGPTATLPLGETRVVRFTWQQDRWVIDELDARK